MLNVTCKELYLGINGWYSNKVNYYDWLCTHVAQGNMLDLGKGQMWPTKGEKEGSRFVVLVGEKKSNKRGWISIMSVGNLGAIGKMGKELHTFVPIVPRGIETKVGSMWAGYVMD